MATDISASSWKAFTKKQKLEGELPDKDLLKALANFDKTDERKPEPRLEALKDLIKEIPKQVTELVKLKKKLGDKPFGLVKDELYAILEEAEKLQKKTQAALDAENDKDDKDDEGEEDEDSAANVLLQPKLLFKQLTMCKKDPERTMKFAFIDGKGKEQPPVLAMHPKLSAKKLFSKLQIATGVKTGAFGSAWIDGTSLMLQLDKPLSGLVKKVRGPVKACGFKIAKAVLWNADGTVFEQDDEAEEAVGAQAAPGAGDASGSTAETGPSAEQIEYRARWAALEPRYLEALQHPQADASKLRAVAGFATGKAGEGLYPAALKGLDSLEALVGATNPPGNGPAKKMPADAAKMAFATRLLKLRPLVDKAVADGHAQAGKLQAQMAAAMKKAQAGDSLGGTEDLKTLETMLADMGTASTEAAAKAKRPEGTADPKLAFNARLTAMFPSIQKAIVGPPPNPAIKLKFSEFGVLAKKADFEGAHAVLDAIEEMLGSSAKGTAAPSTQAGSTPPTADWQGRLAATDETYQRVLKLNPDNAAALRGVMAYAVEQADGGDQTKALAALTRLDGLLKVAENAAKTGSGNGEKGYKGLVAYRTSLLEFRKAVATVNAQIASLKAAIPSQMPEEADLADELSSELSGLTQSLLSAVDEAMNSAENVESPITDAMQGRLFAYAEEVATNELIAHVDDNVFGVAMTVRETLMAALGNIQSNWPVAA